MTDSPASLTDAEKLQMQVRSRIADLTQIAHEHMCDELFEDLDKLHKQGINDDDVIHALRHNGESDLADEYIEWSGALDPDREPNETLGGVVPDPMDADGNRQMAEAAQVQKALDAIVDQLIEERERELYFDFKYDGEDSMLDGPVNLRKLAAAVVKGLGK